MDPTEAEGHRDRPGDGTGAAGGADLAAIQQLLNRYPHAVDDRDWDAFELIFTDDVVCDLEAVGLGTCDGRAALVERFAVIEHPVAHHLVNPVVEVAGDTAHVRSKWLVVLADRTTLSGEYHDDLVRTAAGWRIRRRLVTDRQRGSRRPVGSYDQPRT